MRPLLLTVAEAAPILGVSERRLYALVASGELPADLVVRFGRSVKIKRPAFMRWLGATDASGDDGQAGATAIERIEGTAGTGLVQPVAAGSRIALD